MTNRESFEKWLDKVAGVNNRPSDFEIWQASAELSAGRIAELEASNKELSELLAEAGERLYEFASIDSRITTTGDHKCISRIKQALANQPENNEEVKEEVKDEIEADIRWRKFT
jgi:phosphomannomutase